MERSLEYSELTETIIAAFYRVYNALGYGFLEKVYENALVLTLRKKPAIGYTRYLSSVTKTWTGSST